MADLAQCLYQFLMERRMGYLWKNDEYRTYISRMELQKRQAYAILGQEQRKELDCLLDRIAERDCVEKQH